MNFLFLIEKQNLKRGDFVYSVKIPINKKIILKHIKYQKGLMTIFQLFVVHLICLLKKQNN